MLIDDDLVQVDVGVAPVVRWLNGLPGLATQYSCEGDESHLSPYVVVLGSADHFETVLRHLREYARSSGYASVLVELDYFLERRYVLRWPNHHELCAFIAFFGLR